MVWPDDPDDLWAPDPPAPVGAGADDELLSLWSAAAAPPAPTAPPADSDVDDDGASLWEPDPVLDAPAPQRVAAVAGVADPFEADPYEAEAEAAFQEVGFGGPLHDALGQLRRISDDDFESGPVPSTGSEPDDDVGASERRRRRAGVAAFSGALGAWWSDRWRDVLPGMVVAALVVMAFGVVLATGGGRNGTSHVDTSSSPTTVDPDSLAPPVGGASLPPDLTGADGSTIPASSGTPAAAGGPVDPVVGGPTTTKAKASTPKNPGSTPPGTGTPAGNPGTTRPPPATDPSATTPTPTVPRTTTPTPTVPRTTTIPDVTTTMVDPLVKYCNEHPDQKPPCP